MSAISIYRKLSKIPYQQWLVLWVLVGLTLRLYLIVASGWRIDYDEALVGILAQNIQQGSTPLFIPPEVVGGAGSAYALALLLSSFGSSAITLRLWSLGLSTAYIVTSGLLGYQLAGKRVAVLAALFAAIVPPYMIIVGMKVWAGYIETIVLGNILLLIAIHLLEKPSLKWMLFAGLMSGLMFWLTWLSFYYFVAVGLVFLWRGRKLLLHFGWVGLIAFFIGSAPFWIFNATNDWGTFTRILNDDPMTAEHSLRVLGHFISTNLPLILTGDSHWGTWSPLEIVMMPLIYVAGIWSLFKRNIVGESLRPSPTHYTLRAMLRILTFTIPLIYAISTHSRNALIEWNPWEVEATGRYLLMLHSVFPIGLALLIHRLINRKKYVRNIGFALLLIVLFINLTGILRLNPIRAFDSPYYDRLPYSLDPLIDLLDERGIEHVWTDFGIANVLMFQTEGRILAADYRDIYLADGLIRFPDRLAAIESAEQTAYVTPIYENQQNPPLQQAFDSADIAYEMILVTPMLAVYIPLEPMSPEQVAAGLGYQY